MPVRGGPRRRRGGSEIIVAEAAVNALAFYLRLAESADDLAAWRAARADAGSALEADEETLDPEVRPLLAVARQDSADAPEQPIGAAWWLPTGRVGLPCVVPAWRRRGVGSALLATAVRETLAHGGATPWLMAPAAWVAFCERHGFARAAGTSAAAPIEQLTLIDPSALLPADLGSRYLGVTGGRLRLTQTAHAALAVTALAAQAQNRLDLLSHDLEPALYDRVPFLAAVRRLALARMGRVPVRVLLVDAAPAVRRGHRLIELARQLSSDVQIRAVPEHCAERGDRFLLADDSGYCLTPFHDPQAWRVDFASGIETRRLRAGFARIWEQASDHPALRRLFL